MNIHVETESEKWVNEIQNLEITMATDPLIAPISNEIESNTDNLNSALMY